MSIANFQERILFFSQQKSAITSGLANIQMQQLSATKKASDEQMAYNEELQALYYDEDCGYGTEAYAQILLEMQGDHEFELAAINAWESELEAKKENLETQLNEITNYENTWQNLLKNNIKVEFTYGGSNGGK